jgi:hypothetical protein
MYQKNKIAEGNSTTLPTLIVLKLNRWECKWPLSVELIFLFATYTDQQPPQNDAHTQCRPKI